MICDQHDPISDAAGVEPELFFPCAWPRCAVGVAEDEWRSHEIPSMAGTAVLVGAVTNSWTDYERVKVPGAGKVVWAWLWTKHMAWSGLLIERC